MSSIRAISTLFLVAVAGLGIACTKSTDDSASNESAVAADGPGSMVGGHGMTLFGGADKLYLSHIPLYENPHGKQVIVEVAITGGVPPEALATFNANNFTVRPTAAWSLYDLAAGTLHSIGGQIYFGNFESGGRVLYPAAKFDVKRVIFTQPLSAATPKSASLNYVAVGTPSNAFLVHVIDKTPSFDQVLSVKLDANSFLDAAALEAGTLVKINGGVNGITTRLAASATVDADRLVVASPDANAPAAPGEGGDATDAGPADVSSAITVLKEVGCLPGPEFYGNCPAAAAHP